MRLLLALLLLCGSLHATPSSIFWTFCTTTVLELGKGEFEVNNLFRPVVPARRGSPFEATVPDDMLPTDVGLNVGFLRLGRVSFEGGIDYFGGVDDPLYFNVKGGIRENTLYRGSPSISIGIFDIGTSNTTNFNIWNVVIGKTLPKCRGYLYFGGFVGNRSMGRDQAGWWIAYDLPFYLKKGMTTSFTGGTLLPTTPPGAMSWVGAALASTTTSPLTFIYRQVLPGSIPQRSMGHGNGLSTSMSISSRGESIAAGGIAVAQRTKSETADVRELLSPWCKGFGIDVGAGGDKITPHAISVDLPEPYAFWGSDPVQLGGDARNLFWFQDSVLDFVYSSHLLEDFEDPVEVLNEFGRVLKLGGHLILYLPHEKLFRAYCEANDQPGNFAHKHLHFDPLYVKNCARDALYNFEIVFESGIINHYSFALVLKKRP